jgi:hypothetical protein
MISNEIRLLVDRIQNYKKKFLKTSNVNNFFNKTRMVPIIRTETKFRNFCKTVHYEKN